MEASRPRSATRIRAAGTFSVLPRESATPWVTAWYLAPANRPSTVCVASTTFSFHDATPPSLVEVCVVVAQVTNDGTLVRRDARSVGTSAS